MSTAQTFYVSLNKQFTQGWRGSAASAAAGEGVHPPRISTLIEPDGES